MANHNAVYERIEQVRSTNPLVHNITNYVAMDMSANALLAVGASPAMIHAEEEVADFAPIASALVVNIGTLSPAWVRAMARAMAAAPSKPRVLDPVGAGATPYRTEVAQSLAKSATIIRGNASEVGAVLGEGGGTRGVDATESVAAMLQPAVTLARTHQAIVAMTGEQDFLTDGRRGYWVRGGSDLMTKVTAMGCALSAVVGAFAAGSEPFEGTLAALAAFKAAGSIAAERAQGPGSFKPSFLDALHRLEAQDLQRVEIEAKDV